MKTELLIMAAGMGSRFGGLKQIEPMGPNGQAIIDFSLYDAKEAGFDKAVIIIKKAIEKEFRELCGKRLEKIMDVDYAFQELDKLPEGYKVPEGREKPWGTTHAVLCAQDKLSAPFTVINADDYYGKESFKIAHDWLVNNTGMCMVGYKLGNTLTDNGTVARGVCVAENGILKQIEEHTAIDRNSGFPDDTLVSMNMWGLNKDIFPYLEKDFHDFLETRINEPKSECLLPMTIGRKIREENAQVTVLATPERWYGVTYRDDMPAVKAAMLKFVEEGKYKF
ncbi:MAG: nucleotidyltransferase [Clostridia bacterium]|nr:nucleotidyltransferase [Clostridia bacterium]